MIDEGLIARIKQQIPAAKEVFDALKHEVGMGVSGTEVGAVVSLAVLLAQAQAPEGRILQVPYCTVEAQWYLCEKGFDNYIDNANAILDKIPVNWTKPEYYRINGEELYYRGRIDLSNDDVAGYESLGGVFLTLVYDNVNDSDQKLIVDIDFDENDDGTHIMYFGLFTRFPHFVNGLHDMEHDFIPFAKQELRLDMNVITASFGLEGDDYDPDDISVREAADWYEKLDV